MGDEEKKHGDKVGSEPLQLELILVHVVKGR